MKIVHVLPGSGGTFYCENCLRDTALVQALRRQSQDVILVPMYLPLYTDGPHIARDTPVFFGGINVYLQQKLPLFRATPRWVDRLFDARWMLSMAARREGRTRAAGMGDMTLSMLRGEDGNQAKELERMVAWLAEIEKPDVVHLSLSMLIGLARRIKQVLNVPIVCTMQDEDQWLDALDPGHAAACWAAIRERAADCDRFVTVSEYYRDSMAARLQLDPSVIEPIHIGIDLTGYQLATHDGPPVIGYLSKLCQSLGLDTLVEAFMILKRKAGLEDLQLRAMGGLIGDDRRFLERVRARLARAGMDGDVQFLPDLERAARISFLRGLSVLSVPIPGGEAFGMFMVEAWAAGVPVVQPRVGAFPELIDLTGGGVHYEGDSPDALATALEPLLRDRALARELGERGREGAHREFDVETMAQRMISVYESGVAEHAAQGVDAAALRDLSADELLPRGARDR